MRAPANYRVTPRNPQTRLSQLVIGLTGDNRSITGGHVDGAFLLIEALGLRVGRRRARSVDVRQRLIGELDNKSGLRLVQSARHASFNQILLLVEVQIEVVEQRDLAALVGTSVVVSKVDDDATKVAGLAVDGAGKTVHDLNLDDVLDTEVIGKLLVVLVTTIAVAILEEAHLGKQIGTDEPGRLTGR